MLPLLAQRAASEDPRWTRAVGDQPDRSFKLKNWNGDRSLVDRSPFNASPRSVDYASSECAAILERPRLLSSEFGTVLVIVSVLHKPDHDFHVHHCRRLWRAVRRLGYFDPFEMLAYESVQDMAAAEGCPGLHIGLDF